MNWEQLLEEAHRIARDCFILSSCENAGEAVGFYGEDLFRGRNQDYRHQITVRSDLLPEPPRSPASWTSLIAVPHDEEEGAVLEWSFDPASLPAATVPLGAERYRSLPPLEAIFRYGSESIGDWLGEAGWERERPFSPEFPDELGGRYDRYYLEQYPHGQERTRAVIGGWHNFWPDGDWYFLCDYTFILSVRQAEDTWLELYLRAGEWLIVPRLD